MLLSIAILILLFVFIMINALIRSSLSELSPAFLDAYEAIKPERAKYLISLRSTKSATVRMTLLITDAFLLLGIGSLIFVITSKTSIPFLSEISSLFFALVFVVLLKTIGSAIGERSAEKLTGFTFYIVKFSSALLFPITLLLVRFAEILNPPPSGSEQREEFDALVDTAREEGTLDDGEYRIFKSIMNFSEIRVADIMTPRSVVFSCTSDKTVAEVALMPELLMYSRFPVWEGDSIDGVIGYALTKDVLRAALDGRRSRTLDKLVREVYYIPDNASLEKTLEQFLQRRQHLFVVVDEYGGIEGLITMEDVLETMLGTEIVDEADRVVDLRALAKSRRDKRVSEYQSHGQYHKQEQESEDTNVEE